MIDLLTIAGLVVLLGLILFGACRDERDNMKGGCKAAAVKAL